MGSLLAESVLGRIYNDPRVRKYLYRTVRSGVYTPGSPTSSRGGSISRLWEERYGTDFCSIRRFMGSQSYTTELPISPPLSKLPPRTQRLLVSNCNPTGEGSARFVRTRLRIKKSKDLLSVVLAWVISTRAIHTATTIAHGSLTLSSSQSGHHSSISQSQRLHSKNLVKKYKGLQFANTTSTNTKCPG